MVEAPVRIEVLDKSRVVLTWDDGSVQDLSARLLRASCPCAGCRETKGAARMEKILGGSGPVSVEEAKLVGDYAVNFVFGDDGHRTGIFSFDYLREL